jgi:hypothetical protein
VGEIGPYHFQPGTITRSLSEDYERLVGKKVIQAA